MNSEERNIILTIREYENSVNMPDEVRLTYVDFSKRIHLTAGDSHAFEYRAYAKKCSEYLRFGSEVDEATCGAYSPLTQLKVCDTPALFLKAGFEQKPMLYTQRHLLDAIHAKSTENYHWHGLSVSQIKRLPQLLEQPVLPCDSPSRNDVLLSVLCEVDCDSLPLILAIQPNGHGVYQLESIETNFILSVYGKSNFDKYFSERITPDMVVYFNKEKGRELERLAAIQFRDYYSNFDPDTIIKRPQCLVNDSKALDQGFRSIEERAGSLLSAEVPEKPLPDRLDHSRKEH